jgi:hypothetical protein
MCPPSATGGSLQCKCEALAAGADLPHFTMAKESGTGRVCAKDAHVVRKERAGRMLGADGRALVTSPAAAAG